MAKHAGGRPVSHQMYLNLEYKYILLNKTKSAELCGYKEVENE